MKLTESYKHFCEYINCITTLQKLHATANSFLTAASIFSPRDGAILSAKRELPQRIKEYNEKFQIKPMDNKIVINVEYNGIAIFHQIISEPLMTMLIGQNKLVELYHSYIQYKNYHWYKQSMFVFYSQIENILRELKAIDDDELKHHQKIDLTFFNKDTEKYETLNCNLSITHISSLTDHLAFIPTDFHTTNKDILLLVEPIIFDQFKQSLSKKDIREMVARILETKESLDYFIMEGTKASPLIVYIAEYALLEDLNQIMNILNREPSLLKYGNEILGAIFHHKKSFQLVQYLMNNGASFLRRYKGYYKSSIQDTETLCFLISMDYKFRKEDVRITHRQPMTEEQRKKFIAIRNKKREERGKEHG